MVMLLIWGLDSIHVIVWRARRSNLPDNRGQGTKDMCENILRLEFMA